MTRDLRRSLDEEFAAMTPPTAITRELIIHKGHKARARRRFVFGGGILAGVAVLAAAAVLVPSLFSGGVGGLDVAHDPYPAVDQPVFPLPELDPRDHYAWSPQVLKSATEETRAIDAAWLARIRGITGADVYSQLEGPAWAELTDENYSPVTRDVLDITVADPEDLTRGKGYAEDVAPFYAGGDVLLDFGVKPWAEQLSLAVYAKGSFLPGAGQPYGIGPWPPAPYLVAGCEDYRVPPEGLPADVDYTCSEATGPNGERVLNVDKLVSIDGEQPYRERRTVLYRTDGTAVLLTVGFTYMGQDETGTPPAEFTLTPEHLLDLALSIPPVLVK